MQEIQVSEVEVQKLTKFADTEGQVDTSLHLQSLQPDKKSFNGLMMSNN